ncbi:vWA domain-containing protein [Paractinoplanes lichenicola]|uniref:VWA domain-containing protein n=1 Tax=Paractinoplanes lichenicola TaxID=2802976 RepID=A0ABS1VU96_9ACTN|nr:vWA domain-containing protein [Actinoplanes lichenicola]MBL7258031.1 VWA domain-containing protein [Actinoplanes lichenicola]
MDRIRRAVTGVALSLGLLAATAAPAYAAPATEDEIYAALGVDRVAADYVVMVDVSGSMRAGNRYAQVRSSLRSFVAALAPDDRVSLVTFADGAKVVRRGGPAGRSPDAVLANLPRQADGDHTDIGAAIEEATKLLAREGAPPTATVLLLTDGLHDPAPGSAYPFDEGYSWNQLRATAKKLKKTSLNAYAVPLSGSTGAAQLAKVFPAAKVLPPVSIDRLGAQLEQPKAAARAAKARAALGADARGGITVSWPEQVRDLGAGPTDLRVTLRSGTAHTPLVVDGLAVRSGDPALRATVRPQSVSVPPGGTAEVTVSVDWDAGPRQAAPLHEVTGEAALTLTGTVGSPWYPMMRDRLGMTPAPAWTGGETRAGLDAQRGSLPYWIGGALLLAAVLGTLAVLRRRRLRPPLSGRLEVRTPDGDEHTVTLTGRVLALNAGTAGIPGQGEVRAARASVGAAEVVLTITYSRNGSASARESGTCGPGASVTLSGAVFTWQPSVPAPRGRTPDRSRSLR